MNRYQQALDLDAQDPLKHLQSRFFFGCDAPIYLDGNSLGMLPRDTVSHLQQVITRQWGERLIRSWNEGWYELSARLGSLLAPLIGAGEDEVIFSDSTTVNLYKLAFGALQIRPGRKKIVTDDLNFPTDIYILEGLARQMGREYRVELAGSRDGMTMDEQTLDSLIDTDTALVLLSHTAFKSGFLYDMESVTELARRKGALVLWDLSHSAGALPVRLNDAGADLAAGCSYKYLNGGPGAPAFLYVSSALQQQLPSPIWGWFSEADPFGFSLSYRPAAGIRKFLTGTPPVLSLSAVEPALKLLHEAGMDAIRTKSLKQTQFLLDTADELLVRLGCTVGTPREAHRRGSHISLRHPEAYRICRALINPAGDRQAVIPDFRESDTIRFGIAPLYTRFSDVCRAMERTAEIISTEEFARHSLDRDGVT